MRPSRACISSDLYERTIGARPRYLRTQEPEFSGYCLIDATHSQHALPAQRANRARLSTRLLIEEAARRGFDGKLGCHLDQTYDFVGSP